MADQQDHEFAASAATRAGELLLEIRAEMSARNADGKEMKDEGDRRSHELLMEILATERPDDAVLSDCLLYTSPSPRDATLSRMPSSA